MGIQGFFDLSDQVFKGKGISALNCSRENKSKLIALFGGKENLPSSVMKADKARVTEEVDLPTSKRTYKSTSRVEQPDYAHLSKRLKRAFGVSGKGCSAGALSTFPKNIGKTVLHFYSDPGERVVDPFAGHNSRMELCVRNGRHYTGCDLSTEFMAFNRKRAAELRERYAGAKIKLHHCDSRKMPVADACGDFTLTSPPYWDIEFYGDEPEQLGKNKTYAGFLDGIRDILAENFRCLKPGKFAVWFVNDFRKKGRFYSYHTDTIRAAEEVGFRHHDLMVVDFGKGLRDSFINQAVQQRILPKRHEYGLVFIKSNKE